MNNKEAEISALHSKARSLMKLGVVLTPIATGATLIESIYGNPYFAVASGVCAVVLGGSTIVNVLSERSLRRKLDQENNSQNLLNS